MGVQLEWLEVCGFRAFGSEVRRLDLKSSLIVIHAGNSQGKTSLAEAVEFLITGRSSRRDLFGGAKAEYNASLRNAHLPLDAPVWVAAGLRGHDGELHVVRRDLVADFNGATDSESQLTVDGAAADGLGMLGVQASDGAIAAPVLLQHTLRYVLSTEPKQRAAYFKALLTLTDLDLFRERVHRQLVELQQQSAGPAHLAVARLRAVGHADTADRLETLTGDSAAMRTAAVEVLLAAASPLLPAPADTLEALIVDLKQALQSAEERAFPLAALAVSETPDAPNQPKLEAYEEAMAGAAETVASLLPVFKAVLAVPDLQHLDHGVACAVCTTPDALTPARMQQLRAHVLAGADVSKAADSLSGDLQRARRQLGEWLQRVRDGIPAAGAWTAETEEEQARSAASLLGEDAPELRDAIEDARELRRLAGSITAQAATLLNVLSAVGVAVARRDDAADLPALPWAALDNAVAAYNERATTATAAARFQVRLQPVLHGLRREDGLDDLLRVARQLPDLIEERGAVIRRQDVVKRLTRVERLVKQAAGSVLDSRFASMSEAIERWWATIRPDELVGFAGVKRRAAGAIFVNLVAALQPQERAEAVERDALGVYSDSQLNALGLSTFLARMQLIDSPFVFLDDPIPGSDGDHRLTFVQNTLGALLEDGRQVVLTTYDPKLADWAQTIHEAREPVTYDLNLLDMVEGTEPAQTSDAFSRYMLQGEDGLSAPTAQGRKGACTAYRSAAERLAKQIIATNRTNEGTPTTVADVEREAKMLHELVKLVTPYALSEDERGKWRVMPKVLNPGNHDDDVPPANELRTVRGNLKRFAKAHRSRWGTLAG